MIHKHGAVEYLLSMALRTLILTMVKYGNFIVNFM